MSNKALSQQQKEAQLNEWKADIDKIKAKSLMVGADAQIEMNKQIHALEKKIDEGKVKHSDLTKATDLPSHNDEETLYDIPELEVNNTLIRMEGNVKQLRKLICRFSETQADAVVRIKKALAYDDIETARLEVHALKNFAGTIGATLLEDHAQIVEKMCENCIVDGRDEAVHNLEIDLINLLARIYTAYGTQGET